MFASNRRRASIVSDTGEDDGDESTWAGTGAHPTASSSVTSQADEIFVGTIHLCGKWFRNLNRSRRDWRLRFP
jgi:hypothetical protein